VRRSFFIEAVVTIIKLVHLRAGFIILGLQLFIITNKKEAPFI
jgi:hypothetical protein